MKRTILFLAAAIMLGMSMPTMAQQKKAPAKRTTTTKKSGTTKQAPNPPTASTAKNPLVGSWFLDDGQYSLELRLNETSKKGNFIHNNTTVCHGGLAVAEYYEYFMMLSMELKEKVSDTEVIYTAWGENTQKRPKTVKGTIHLKKVGDGYLISGKDSNGKKWLFDGFTLHKN